MSTQAERDQALNGIADVFIGAFNDALMAGRDAIWACIDAQEALIRVGLTTAIGLNSGAAHELEFYTDPTTDGRAR